MVGARPFKRPKKDEEGDEGSEEDWSASSSLETPEEIRSRSFKRARRNLIDTINTNVFGWKDEEGAPYPPVFLTLTFKDNITNIPEANYEYTKFIRRMNWEAYDSKQSILKYVVVIEFQKRGSIHYHVILFNLPYIHKTTVADVWGHGFIKIKMIEDVSDVGFYVTKYMSKDFDDPRLEKNKSYFVSKGLLKPTIIYTEGLINEIKRVLPQESLEFEKDGIPVKRLAYMDHKRYNLKNHQVEKFVIDDLLKHYL